ncbi:hypothetical protein OAF46_01905, partial [Akkermansiaceae bacterium]|nr:hypothetical protein [Akkermansiaceae bacterium]
LELWVIDHFNPLPGEFGAARDYLGQHFTDCGAPGVTHRHSLKSEKGGTGIIARHPLDEADYPIVDLAAVFEPFDGFCRSFGILSGPGRNGDLARPPVLFVGFEVGYCSVWIERR